MILTQASTKVGQLIAFPEMPLCQLIKLYSSREDKACVSMATSHFTKTQDKIHNSNCMLILVYERKN